MQPTDAVPGIGERTSAELAKVGVSTVGALKMADPQRIAAETNLSAGDVRELQTKAENSSEISEPLETFTSHDDPVVATFEALDRVSQSETAVLHPAEFLDYYAVSHVGLTPSGWADLRCVGSEAVRKNVRQAAASITEMEGGYTEDDLTGLLSEKGS